MNTRDQRAEQILAEVLELPDAAARGAHLDRACAADAALPTEVESLLAAHEQAGQFIQHIIRAS